MSEDLRRWVLASRPEGAPDASNFRMETSELPEPDEGEVLVRVLWLSLDPYMRGRMSAAKSYAEPLEIGQTMGGGTVAQVIASRADGFEEGDIVLGMAGWASHGVLPARTLRRLDPEIAPVQTALGVLGMPGFTGWYGLTQLGRPEPGETVVVGAATGPVGSMVGQLAKVRGLRAVGVAGGPEKCAHAVDELGFEACLDHRAHDADGLRDALAEACPDGVDIYYENVGGETLRAVLPLMNVGGRVPVCGMIAWYDLGGADATVEGPDRLPWAWRTILDRRLSVSGFIIADHFDRFDEFTAEIAPLLDRGTLTWREDVSEGLESAPEAFLSMLGGGNLGKQLVRVADPV